MNTYLMPSLPYKLSLSLSPEISKLIENSWLIKKTTLNSSPDIIAKTCDNSISIHLPIHNIQIHCKLISRKQVEFLLRFAIEIISMYHGLFIFHASSVKIDKKGFLFLGDSGNGKSTIARILSPDCLYGDDTAIVYCNLNKIYITLPTPFEKLRHINNNYNTQPLPIVNMFSITHATQNRTKYMPIEKKIYLLLNNSLLFLYLNNKHKTPFLSIQIRQKLIKHVFISFYEMINTLNISALLFNLELNRAYLIRTFSHEK